MELAQRHQDQLKRIKTNVRRSYDYFKPNYDRYNEFRRFVFESSLTNDELTLLATLARPQLEFNVLEAYISRLLGEFSKQEPDIEVSAENQEKADPMIVEVVEQHLRHTLSDQKNYHTRYEVYKDLLSGGFSSLKVKTEYSNPMSFQQVICIERVFDPTLCGFDQLARYSHKGDGRFCFELFPMSEEDFKDQYPEVKTDTINFRRNFSGFNWTYINGSTPILIVADYYDKKPKHMKIVQLRDEQGQMKVMPYDKYKEMLDTWDDFAQPPELIGKPRETTLDTIVRYRCIENKVLEHEETDFQYLPLVFVDGSSVLIKTQNNANIHQVTRPYVYHAKGAQRLKNYAGISLANEIENTVQHKFMVAKEALPKEEELLAAYKDVQKANVLIFNSVHEANPEMPIVNPIREVQRIPCPPEIISAFTGSDSLIQNVLGSYDAALGINNNQLSGVALVEAASQSNATAMPYIVGYLQGYQRAAQLYVDLLPKYYTTPSTLPVMDQEGKKNFVKINQQDGIDMDYESNALNVELKAGASFQVQKSRAIMMVKEMMGMSELFQQFIAEKGLNFVLDNMEGKGIDQLKAMVDSWLQEMQQKKAIEQKAQQDEIQNNPAMIKNQIEMQKLQQDGQKSQAQFMIDMKKLELDEKKVMADIAISQSENEVQALKANTEKFSKEADLKMKNIDMAHRHAGAVATHHLARHAQHQSNMQAERASQQGMQGA